MAKKKKITPMQSAYKKELQRIKRGLNKAKRRGYIFEDKVDEMLQMPKRVTKKRLKEISELKTEDFYKHSVKLINYDGEVIPGTEARKQEKAEANRKRKLTRERNRIEKQRIAKLKQINTPIEEYEPYVGQGQITVDNLINQLEKYGDRANKAIKYIKTLIAQEGYDSVAEAINNCPANFYDNLYSVEYDSDEALTEYALSLAEYLPLSRSEKDDIIDEQENFLLDNYADELDYNEQ